MLPPELLTQLMEQEYLLQVSGAVELADPANAEQLLAHLQSSVSDYYISEWRGWSPEVIPFNYNEQKS